MGVGLAYRLRYCRWADFLVVGQPRCTEFPRAQAEGAHSLNSWRLMDGKKVGTSRVRLLVERLNWN